MIVSTAASSVSCHSSWPTPSSSCHDPMACASDGSSRFDRPSARDSPHTGDRLVVVARSRSSRSLFAFGVVCSWGRTSPVPGGSSPSAPITPRVWWRRPASSAKVIRYRYRDGSSVSRIPSASHPRNRAAASAYGSSPPSGKSTRTTLCGMALDEPPALVGVDHVVGRRRDRAEVVACVPDARERSEAGHPSILA